MNKALNFVRLDFLTVKPYLTFKNLIILIGLPIIFIFDSDTSIAANGFIIAFAALFASYPFAVGERNGIDTLYPTLSIKRNSVVLGRYLFTLSFNICAGLLSFFYSLVAMTILQRDFNALETCIIVFLMLVIFTILQAVQLPIYFKLGYAKAKMLAYLPFFAITFIVLAAKNIFGDGMTTFVADSVEWINSNPIIAVALLAATWLAIMTISYQISLAYYQKRDF